MSIFKKKKNKPTTFEIRLNDGEVVVVEKRILKEGETSFPEKLAKANEILDRMKAANCPSIAGRY